MSCIVAPELASSHLLLLMKVDGFNLVLGSLKITLDLSLVLVAEVLKTPW